MGVSSLTRDYTFFEQNHLSNGTLRASFGYRKRLSSSIFGLAPIETKPTLSALPSISRLIGPTASHHCPSRLEGSTPSLPWISLVGVFEGPRSASGCVHISSRSSPTQALEFCFRRDRLPPIPSLSPRGAGQLLRRTSSAIRPCQQLARHRPEPPQAITPFFVCRDALG